MGRRDRPSTRPIFAVIATSERAARHLGTGLRRYGVPCEACVVGNAQPHPLASSRRRMRAAHEEIGRLRSTASSIICRRHVKRQNCQNDLPIGIILVAEHVSKSCLTLNLGSGLAKRMLRRHSSDLCQYIRETLIPTEQRDAGLRVSPGQVR